MSAQYLFSSGISLIIRPFLAFVTLLFLFCSPGSSITARATPAGRYARRSRIPFGSEGPFEYLGEEELEEEDLGLSPNERFNRNRRNRPEAERRSTPDFPRSIPEEPYPEELDPELERDSPVMRERERRARRERERLALLESEDLASYERESPPVPARRSGSERGSRESVQTQRSSTDNRERGSRGTSRDSNTAPTAATRIRLNPNNNPPMEAMPSATGYFGNWNSFGFGQRWGMRRGPDNRFYDGVTRPTSPYYRQPVMANYRPPYGYW